MEIDDLLNRYFEGETTVAEENALRNFFRSEEVPERLAGYKPFFAYFDEEIRKAQNTGKVGCISNCRTDLCVLDCFVPRNDDTCRRHCEERSNPENLKNDNLKYTRKVQSGGRSRQLFYWAAAAASVLIMLGIWQAHEGFLKPDPCRSSSGYVIINGRCYADVEKARALALDALLKVATPAEDFFPDAGFFTDN